jgi:hypothetical protein
VLLTLRCALTLTRPLVLNYIPLPQVMENRVNGREGRARTRQRQAADRSQSENSGSASVGGGVRAPTTTNSNVTVPELRNRLRAAGLSTSGRKADLVARLGGVGRLDEASGGGGDEASGNGDGPDTPHSGLRAARSMRPAVRPRVSWGVRTSDDWDTSGDSEGTAPDTEPSSSSEQEW